MVQPVHPEAPDDAKVVGGIRIGPGMMLSLHKIDYFYDHDWLGDPDKLLVLEITHVGEQRCQRGPNDELPSDWVIIVGHEYVSTTNTRCHCIAVRISALEKALHEPSPDRVTD